MSGDIVSIRVDYTSGEYQLLDVPKPIPAEHAGSIACVLAQLCRPNSGKRLLCKYEFLDADGETSGQYESRFGDGK